MRARGKREEERRGLLDRRLADTNDRAILQRHAPCRLLESTIRDSIAMYDKIEHDSEPNTRIVFLIIRYVFFYVSRTGPVVSHRVFHAISLCKVFDVLCIYKERVGYVISLYIAQIFPMIYLYAFLLCAPLFAPRNKS